MREVIGPIIETEVDEEITGIAVVIEEAIIPEAIEEIIIDKTMVTKGTEIGTEVPSLDCSRSRQRYRSNSRDNSRNRSYDRSQSRNRERVETETDPVVERKDKD